MRDHAKRSCSIECLAKKTDPDVMLAELLTIDSSSTNMPDKNFSKAAGSYSDEFPLIALMKEDSPSVVKIASLAKDRLLHVLRFTSIVVKMLCKHNKLYV